MTTTVGGNGVNVAGSGWIWRWRITVRIGRMNGQPVTAGDLMPDRLRAVLTEFHPVSKTVGHGPCATHDAGKV